MLRDRDKRFLKSKFESQLRENVKLVVFTQEFECEYCAKVRVLAEELASLSDKITVEVYDSQSDRNLAEKWRVDKIPALLVFREKEYGIRFFGVPSGYEFMTLVDDIIDVSRRTSRLNPSVEEKVQAINEPVHIQVFVTPTCPYCPLVIRVTHQMALENNLITSDMIEALEFPHLANKYQVMAVPKIVINNLVSFEGAVPEQVFAEYVLAALEKK